MCVMVTAGNYAKTTNIKSCKINTSRNGGVDINI